MGRKATVNELFFGCSKLKDEDMRLVLGNHSDFNGEKSSIERFLMEERGHIVNFILSNACGHCLSDILQHQHSTQAYHPRTGNCNIQNYFRKVRHYIFAYLESLPGGSDLEKLVKN